MKNNICDFTDNKFLTVKPRMLFFSQTIMGILWILGFVTHTALYNASTIANQGLNEKQHTWLHRQ